MVWKVRQDQFQGQMLWEPKVGWTLAIGLLTCPLWYHVSGLVILIKQNQWLVELRDAKLEGLIKLSGLPFCAWRTHHIPSTFECGCASLDATRMQMTKIVIGGPERYMQASHMCLPEGGISMGQGHPMCLSFGLQKLYGAVTKPIEMWLSPICHPSGVGSSGEACGLSRGSRLLSKQRPTTVVQGQQFHAGEVQHDMQ